eukprot:315333_1
MYYEQQQQQQQNMAYRNNNNNTYVNPPNKQYLPPNPNTKVQFKVNNPPQKDMPPSPIKPPNKPLSKPQSLNRSKSHKSIHSPKQNNFAKPQPLILYNTQSQPPNINKQYNNNM